jgi:hypothetical protein
VRSGDLKSPAQPEDPFSRLDHTLPGRTRRKNCPLDAAEIEERDLLGRQDPVLSIGRVVSVRFEVRTRHRKACDTQRIFPRTSAGLEESMRGDVKHAERRRELLEGRLLGLITDEQFRSFPRGQQ